MAESTELAELKEQLAQTHLSMKKLLAVQTLVPMLHRQLDHWPLKRLDDLLELLAIQVDSDALELLARHA